MTNQSAWNSWSENCEHVQSLWANWISCTCLHCIMSAAVKHLCATASLFFHNLQISQQFLWHLRIFIAYYYLQQKLWISCFLPVTVCFVIVCYGEEVTDILSHHKPRPLRSLVPSFWPCVCITNPYRSVLVEQWSYVPMGTVLYWRNAAFDLQNIL